MVWIISHLLLDNSCQVSPWCIALSTKNSSPGNGCNLCFYCFPFPPLPPPPPHSVYHSVIYGVRRKELMRFRNLPSSVSTFIMWCWACILVSLKFYCLIYKINMLKRISWKALAGAAGSPNSIRAGICLVCFFKARSLCSAFHFFVVLSFPPCLVHVRNTVLMKWIFVE